MKELLLKGAEQMGVAMTAEQAQAFCEYHRMLVSANKTMNLTRISDDPAEAVDRNYLDSIAPLKYPLPEGFLSPPAGDILTARWNPDNSGPRPRRGRR